MRRSPRRRTSPLCAGHCGRWTCQTRATPPRTSRRRCSPAARRAIRHVERRPEGSAAAELPGSSLRPRACFQAGPGGGGSTEGSRRRLTATAGPLSCSEGARTSWGGRQRPRGGRGRISFALSATCVAERTFPTWGRDPVSSAFVSARWAARHMPPLRAASSETTREVAPLLAGQDGYGEPNLAWWASRLAVVRQLRTLGHLGHQATLQPLAETAEKDRGIFSSRISPLRSSLHPRLYDRFGWPSRRDRVCMAVHDPPGALFGSKDAGDPQGHRDDLLPSAHFGPIPFHFHDVGKLGSDIRGHGLEVDDLPVPVQHCGALHRGRSLLPAAGRRAKGVRDADIVAMRIHHLERRLPATDEV